MSRIKLLSCLGSLVLIGSAISTVVSCGDPKRPDEENQVLKDKANKIANTSSLAVKSGISGRLGYNGKDVYDYIGEQKSDSFIKGYEGKTVKESFNDDFGDNLSFNSLLSVMDKNDAKEFVGNKNSMSSWEEVLKVVKSIMNVTKNNFNANSLSDFVDTLSDLVHINLEDTKILERFNGLGVMNKDKIVAKNKNLKAVTNNGDYLSAFYAELSTIIGLVVNDSEAEILNMSDIKSSNKKNEYIVKTLASQFSTVLKLSSKDTDKITNNINNNLEEIFEHLTCCANSFSKYILAFEPSFIDYGDTSITNEQMNHLFSKDKKNKEMIIEVSSKSVTENGKFDIKGITFVEQALNDLLKNKKDINFNRLAQILFQNNDTTEMPRLFSKPVSGDGTTSPVYSDKATGGGFLNYTKEKKGMNVNAGTWTENVETFNCGLTPIINAIIYAEIYNIINNNIGLGIEAIDLGFIFAGIKLSVLKITTGVSNIIAAFLANNNCQYMLSSLKTDIYGMGDNIINSSILGFSIGSLTGLTKVPSSVEKILDFSKPLMDMISERPMTKFIELLRDLDFSEDNYAQIKKILTPNESDDSITIKFKNLLSQFVDAMVMILPYKDLIFNGTDGLIEKLIKLHKYMGICSYCNYINCILDDKSNKITSENSKQIILEDETEITLDFTAAIYLLSYKHKDYKVELSSGKVVSVLDFVKYILGVPSDNSYGYNSLFLALANLYNGNEESIDIIINFIDKLAEANQDQAKLDFKKQYINLIKSKSFNVVNVSYVKAKDTDDLENISYNLTYKTNKEDYDYKVELVLDSKTNTYKVSSIIKLK